MDQRVRAVVDVEQHRVGGCIGLRRDQVAHVADHQLQPRIVDLVGRRHGRMQLGDQHPPNPLIGQQGASGEAEPEPADHDVAGAPFEHQLGQPPLRGRLDVVHDEDAVHPQLECAVVPAAQHDVVRGGHG